MKLRRALQCTLVLAVFGPVILNYSSTETRSRQPESGECQVILSGTEQPTSLPAQNVWEETFREYVAVPGVGIMAGPSPEVRSRTAPFAAAALERVSALRRSFPPGRLPGSPEPTTLDRDLVIADTLLDARDDMLRQVSVDEFESLNAYAEQTARRMTVVLPMAGRVIDGGDQTYTCELEVAGKDRPELIPEYRVWRSFLSLWARAAKQNLSASGQFAPEYLDTVRRRSFRMQHEEITTFLKIAISSAAEFDQLSKSSATVTSDRSREPDLLIQRSVMKSRHTLLRALTVDGWRAVLRRFDRARVNTKFWYRAPLNQ